MNIYNTFVISDLHFGHENMRRLRQSAGIGGFDCPTVEAMNEMLIDNWNAAVKPYDHVIVLGDFCWKEKDFEKIITALHGQKTLVTGNHDTRKVKKSPLWENVTDLLRLKVGEESNSPRKDRVEIFCCHYPMRSWNKSFHGSFHIYGHTHADDMRDRREFNVGVDMSINPYYPRRLYKVLAAMAGRWFPKRGGEPLPDRDPMIMAKFRADYNKPFSLETLLKERDALAEKESMLDLPLGGDEKW